MTSTCVFDGTGADQPFVLWDYSPSLQRVLIRSHNNEQNLDLIFSGVERMWFDKTHLISPKIIHDDAKALYLVQSEKEEVAGIKAAFFHCYRNRLDRMHSSIEGTEMEYGERVDGEFIK